MTTKRTCAIRGCRRPSYCRSWCTLHYGRWRRNGDPEARRLKFGDVRDRFWSKVRPGPNGCFEFRGPVMRSGHRQVSYKGRMRLAHRVAWELEYGPIPEGKVVRHRCGNPACVRPDHLRLGVPDENNRDQVLWNRAARRLIQAHRVEFERYLREEDPTLDRIEITA